MDLPQILKYKLGLGFLALIFITQSESNCNRGCDLALASYYVWRGSNLTFISTSLSTTIPHILKFNPQITNPDYIIAGSRINVPFPCDCLNRDFLGHQFVLFAKSGATYRKVAETYFSNLVTVESLRRINSYSLDFVSSADVKFNVILNCSCGDATVSRDYGLFVTYPLRDGESLVSVAVSSGLPLNIIQSYNPNVNSGIGGELIVIPGKGLLVFFSCLGLRSR